MLLDPFSDNHGHNLQTVKFYFCAGNKKFLQIFFAEAGRKPA